MPSTSPFTWDDRAGRFRDARGRFVSETRIRAGVDNVVSLASQNMLQLTRQFRTTDMTIDAWVAGMFQEIKLAHVAAALAAYGGKEQISQQQWGQIGSVIRNQYGFVRKFAHDMLEGRQVLNGRADVRAAQYGNAVRTTYENLRRQAQVNFGYTYERNVLHARESCAECLNATGRGSVPVGTLPAIGTRLCRSACRCTLTYSKRVAFDEDVRAVRELAAAS